MNKKLITPAYYNILLVFWALLLVICYALTITTARTEKFRYYDKQIEASTLASQAMQIIKDKKIELGLSWSKEDKYDSGMLGPVHTQIQTTEGEPTAKRTSTNPNFAAVYIKMFKEAGLKAGDEIAIVTSGSFPALNISATIAAQVYGLKTVTMTGIGASSYGATDVNFTYFDMARLLYEKGIYEKEIDYVSFGGGFDDGSEFDQTVRNDILNRINNSGSTFLCESNFQKNIQDRVKLIYEKCPNIKLLLNVGGSLVAMGSGYTNATNYRGLVMPNYLNLTKSSTKDEYKGLLEVFLEKGIPVIQMLNITKIAFEYGLPQDPVGIPSVGSGNVYYDTSYNVVIPIIGIIVSIGMLAFYLISRKKYII